MIEYLVICEYCQLSRIYLTRYLVMLVETHVVKEMAILGYHHYNQVTATLTATSYPICSYVHVQVISPRPTCYPTFVAYNAQLLPYHY